MPALYVIAYLNAKEDKVQDVEQELKAIIPIVRQEEGCLRYDLHRDAKSSNILMFYEAWQDDEALAAHAASEHMKAFAGKAKDLLAAPPEISTFRAVDVT